MELVRSVKTTPVLGFEPGAAWKFAADARNHGVTTLADLGSPVLMDDEAVSTYRSAVDDPAFEEARRKSPFERYRAAVEALISGATFR